MYEIFEQLLHEKGVKVADVCNATGLKPSTISEWKNGKSQLRIDKLLSLAKYFGVSLDYLCGNEIGEPTLIIKAITPPNVEALQRVYSQLNTTGQDKVIAYAEDLIQSGLYKKDSPVHLIAARGDGGVKELSEEEYQKLKKAVQAMPIVDDL
ncbi:MAG: helix-turn-helix transcriptional regulator [Clostridiales bacterium]|nr:helix-turn-helix transcriptional regulator [Clostridiales bacterium]